MALVVVKMKKMFVVGFSSFTFGFFSWFQISEASCFVGLVALPMVCTEKFFL